VSTPVLRFPAEQITDVRVGVTPFASILKHIWYRQRKNHLGTLKRVEFFWVCRDAPSFGWFQSLLQEVEAAQADREFIAFSDPEINVHQCVVANFLRINIYLTQKIDEDMLWNIAVNDAGADYDPLTLLRSRTMFGRPDWMSIYGRMRQAIEAGQYIPGSNEQLKSRVGVSAVVDLSSNEPTHNVSFSDLLLRSWCSRQGHQRGHRSSQLRKCRLHVCQGSHDLCILFSSC
jgi:hypothetical protein